MSTTVRQMLERWSYHVRYKGGGGKLPDDRGDPHIRYIEDLMGEGESMIFADGPPQLREKTGTITTVDGTASYALPTDLRAWDLRHVTILVSSTGDERQIEVISHETMNRLYPGWDDGTVTGVPELACIIPETKYLGLYPVPSDEWTVSLWYMYADYILALPNTPSHFLQHKPTDGTLYRPTFNSGMAHLFIDRPRLVTGNISRSDSPTQRSPIDPDTGSIDADYDYFTVTYRRKDDQELAENVYFEDTLDTVETVDYAEEIISIQLPTIYDYGTTTPCRCRIGIGDCEATNVTTASMLPDELALRAGPAYAAWKWLAERGDRRASLMEENFVDAYEEALQFPRSRGKVFAFGRGEGGRIVRPRPHSRARFGG